MINSIGLIINYRKKQSILMGKKLLQRFEKMGIAVYAPENDGKVLEMDSEHISSELGKKVQCVITLGGDGTFLRAARYVTYYGVPILGINMGTLGFLTEIEVYEIDKAVEKLISGDFWTEDRMMIEAKIIRNKQIVKTYRGLNDVVINKGPLSRIVTLEIYVDNEFVTIYKADGVILASPTGSTAYSLSAGGPIVYPELEVTIITPICAHTFDARPIVLPSYKTVRVIVINQAESMVTIDGQRGFELAVGDEIIISKAPYPVQLIRIKEKHFFSILREKLNTKDDSHYD
ncbi:MAG: NAD(+)/NADH kinase [Clostridia bacterium]|nr:NAD(+)/NADH kinase [Clostridia bacterium]MDD4049373.1 NAD(+)/NADH kinase [Clostridia bacterium]